MDEFMRVMMRIGQRFEDWSCLHVNFDLLTDVWPYLLEDRFGEACLNVRESVTLAEFDDDDCLSVAFQLRLPVIVDGTLPVPVDERAENPVVGSPFKALRIQTVRDEIGGSSSEPFVLGDDPCDEQFGPLYFGLYGVGEDGLLEHIASRQTYADALRLARSLAPGIGFPDRPCPAFGGG